VVVIEDPLTVSVDDGAVLRVSPGRKIVFLRHCVVEAGAVIVADTADCVISHSSIARGTRIRNSVVHGVYAGQGSQILETVMAPVASGKGELSYALTLGAGFDFAEDNFAFSRGAVVKRIPELRIQQPIVIPIGHSLISRDEFERLKTRAGNIEPRMVVDERYLCINSQDAHPEPHERLYDPRQFERISFVSGEPGNPRADEIRIDLFRLRKARAADDRMWRQEVETIYRDSLSSARMVFVDSERGAILLETDERYIRTQETSHV
jgi:hypothetical protein